MKKSKCIPKSNKAAVKKVATNFIKSDTAPVKAEDFKKQMKALLSVPKPS